MNAAEGLRNLSNFVSASLSTTGDVTRKSPPSLSSLKHRRQWPQGPAVVAMDITPASPAYRAITVANCSARIVAFRGSPCISIFIPRKTVPDEPKTAAPTQKPEVGCKAYPCTAAASPIKNLSTFTLYIYTRDTAIYKCSELTVYQKLYADIECIADRKGSRTSERPQNEYTKVK